MDSVKLRLTGHEDIDKVLRGLPKQLTHRVLQAAHRAAAKPLVEAEKLTAPEGPTGRLVDSIGIVNIPSRGSASLGEIHVGPRRDGRYKGGRVAHLVEYGTKPRYTKGKGRYRAGTYRGRMKPRPFARPAWDRTRSAVLAGINDNIARSLLRFMKRTIKKHG